MSATTTRLGMPMIEPGQAQKELFHNEALAVLDIAIGATVEAVGTTAPPASPVAGQCWIVGADPTGAWAGHAGAIAGWTSGGWRFVPPIEGLAAWNRSSGSLARRTGDAWNVERPGAVIADPAGGATIDVEARVAIGAVLSALRLRGIVGI